VLALNAEAALQAADFEFADDCARQFLQARPGDPRMLFLLVEVRRKRAEKNDLAEALRLAEELRAQHPGFPDTYRSLGLLHLKAGRKPEAAAAFRRYLELSPAAPDRTYIENFLQQCAPSA
jgi:tetratricopeptide (TPR) repeat protein